MSDNVDNIIAVARQYKNICISIINFTDFLKHSENPFFEPITVRVTLMSGLYCYICGCNCFVGKDVPEDHIKVSNEDVENNKDIKWSIPIPIKYMEDFDRYIKLKAFW
jgi:hypothetical protein